MSSPAELLKLAQELKAEQGASRRASISRAYYAAFHALHDAIEPMLVAGDRGRNGCAGHGAVVRCLRNWAKDHPDPKKAMAHGADAFKCAQHFAYCMEERERADYQMGKSGETDIGVAVTVIGKADRILKFAGKAR